MALEYKQQLSERLKALYFEDPRYKDLRVLINEQCNKSDGLVFAVRKNEIHIYYRGGRLLKITEKENGKALKLYTDPKYAGDKDDPTNEIAKFNKEDIPKGASEWRDRLEKLKRYVADYYAEHGNEERLLQHNLELNNRDFNGEVVIIDNEYGVRKIAAQLTHLDRSNQKTFGEFTDKELAILSEHEPKLTKDDVLAMSDDELANLKLEYKLCKVDLVALFKGDDGKYKICLTELKKGNGATGGKAGIKDHLRDYKIFVQCRKSDIVASVKNLIEYKMSKEIGTITNNPAEVIELDEENIYISILCYDLSSETKIKNVKNDIEQVYDDEAKRALPFFHYNLRMKEKVNGYTLRKEDFKTRV